MALVVRRLAGCALPRLFVTPLPSAAVCLPCQRGAVYARSSNSSREPLSSSGVGVRTLERASLVDDEDKQEQQAQIQELDVPILAVSAEPSSSAIAAVTPLPLGRSALPFGFDLHHPAVMVLGVLGFALISYDVFHPEALHFTRPIDAGLAAFGGSLPGPVRFFSDKVVSNPFIVAGEVGWVACTAAAFLSSNRAALPVMGLCWAFYLLGAGQVQGEALLVDILKHGFERIRPDPLYHHSFSYPSGHTAAATFLMGTLIFVMLPVVFGQRKEDGRLLTRCINAAQNSWQLWAASGVVTAVGRVTATAHWFTDTLASSFLCLAIVSLLTYCSNRVLDAHAEEDGEVGLVAVKVAEDMQQKQQRSDLQ